MTKLTIPVILVATVMVAGIFAFMPVQQASTVHTVINTSLNNLNIITTDFVQVAAIANLGNIGQNEVDTFGANDDNQDVAAFLSLEVRLTVTNAPVDIVDCDVAVTIIDSNSGFVFINDVLTIDGTSLNEIGFQEVNNPVDAIFDDIDISIQTDGAAADDCDNLGLTLDTRTRVFT